MQELFPSPVKTVSPAAISGVSRRPNLAGSAISLTCMASSGTNTLSRDKLNYETGTIRNIHYGDIHTKFKPLFRVGDEYVPYINSDASANGFDDDALL